jgi:hypothetical protein
MRLEEREVGQTRLCSRIRVRIVLAKGVDRLSGSNDGACVVKGVDEKPKSYAKKMASSHKATTLDVTAVCGKPLIVMEGLEVRRRRECGPQRRGKGLEGCG